MKRATLLILGALLALGGCSPRAVGLRPLREDAVVLAFGDSITRGAGVDERESYPSVLATLLGCRVVNAGVPGEVSADGLRRLPAVLDRVRPDLVILCHGGNDLLQRLDQRQTARNLEAMVKAARERGADVILVGVPRPGLILRTAPLYREVAAACRVPCEARALARILSTPSLKSDQIHPNAAGYRSLAESLAEQIRRGAAP
jgi:acyl-CoA thioesterase I